MSLVWCSEAVRAWAFGPRFGVAAPAARLWDGGWVAARVVGSTPLPAGKSNVSCAPCLCERGSWSCVFFVFCCEGRRNGACRSPPPLSCSARVRAPPWTGRWAWRPGLRGPALGPTSIASPPPLRPIPRAPPVVTRARWRPSPCRVFPLSFSFFLLALTFGVLAALAWLALGRARYLSCRRSPPPPFSFDRRAAPCVLAGWRIAKCRRGSVVDCLPPHSPAALLSCTTRLPHPVYAGAYSGSHGRSGAPSPSCSFPVEASPASGRCSRQTPFVCATAGVLLALKRTLGLEEGARPW